MIFKGPGYMGNGSAIEVGKDGLIIFGKNFGITSSFRIVSRKKITIGDNFSSSWEVQVFDTDFHEMEHVVTGERNISTKEIVIGNDVWLGNRCTVLKGAYIPSRSTVACNSVFLEHSCKNEQNVIYAGIPARPVKTGWTRVEFLHFAKNPIENIVEFLNL